MNLIRTISLAVTAIIAMAVITSPVFAQKAPAKPAVKKTTKKAPTVRKKAATRTNARAKRTTPARNAAPKKAAKKRSKAKAPSACAGLEKRACSAKSQCGWIVPKKKVATNGRKLTAYCRKTAGIASKKK